MTYRVSAQFETEEGKPIMDLARVEQVVEEAIRGMGLDVCSVWSEVE